MMHYVCEFFWVDYHFEQCIKQAFHEKLSALNHFLRDRFKSIRQMQELICAGNIPNNKVEKGHRTLARIRRPCERIKYRTQKCGPASVRWHSHRTSIRIWVFRQIKGH